MNDAMKWRGDLRQYIEEIDRLVDQVYGSREEALKSISTYIRNRLSEKPKVVVICTHNSRRSHFGQIWLQIASYYYNKKLFSYSGGTEATAFHPNAVSAVERAGFLVSEEGDQGNPTYNLSFADGFAPINCFSKTFSHLSNPQSDFAAILVCDSAAEACPFVPGANSRFVLPYNDPKEFDGTSQEELKYDERCQEIAREMFFIMKHV